MSNVVYRFTELKDLPGVLNLINELADFENEPDAVEITLEDLERDAFGDQPKFKCIVAVLSDRVIGMALFYPRYSTWKGPTLHLEDLIITKSERGTGVGQSLYESFISYAHKEEVRRIEWVVLDWNVHAINFYKNSGAQVLEDWRTVQMDQAAMSRYLAKKNENI